MHRRHLLKILAGAGALLIGRPAPARPAPRRRLLVQDSPLAGFAYHHGPRLWPRLAPGQTLTLVREPDNRHDRRAVAIHWHGERLGYLPAFENTAVAQMLDRGLPLEAEILALEPSRNPWRRLRLRVWLEASR